MPSREFDTQQLIDWEIDEMDDCEHLVHIGEQQFDYERAIVFRAPDDGRLWSIDVEFNNGAGYNSIIGTACRRLGDALKPARLRHVGHEVEPKTRTITCYEKVAEPEPVTMEVLTDLLGLIMAESGDKGGVFDIVPSVETLKRLTPEQREEVADWAGDCHLEASDNDVHPGPCPEPLRSMLPDDHFYKDWRVG